jgi:hypothetical protein
MKLSEVATVRRMSYCMRGLISVISAARVSEREGGWEQPQERESKIPRAQFNVNLIAPSIETSRESPVEAPFVQPQNSSCCPPSDELPLDEWLLLVLNQQTAPFEAFGIFKMLAPPTT